MARSAVAALVWSDKYLAQSTAENVVNQYIYILEHSSFQQASATQRELLTDHCQEISDSILSLEANQ